VLVALQSPAPESKPVPLFDGRSLAGWHALGDASYTVAPGESGRAEIVGKVAGGAQSFLVSDRAYADFELELELRNEAPGNSGVQIRSHVNDKGRLYGYQIEIDPSARAWSGGLYDEARRGWLDDLADDEKARKAFKPGEWNRYRIVCDGPWIRAWVNGVPTADRLDPLDLDGHFALQVHSGKDTHVRWRDFALVERGAHRWVDAKASELGALEAGRGAVKLELAADARGTLALVELAPTRVPATDVACGSGLVRTGDGWRFDLAADPAPRELCWITWDGRHALLVDGKQLVDWRAEAGKTVPARFAWSGTAPLKSARLERVAPTAR
jgi:hypothetical protein